MNLTDRLFLTLLALLLLHDPSGVSYVAAKLRQQPQPKCPTTKVICPTSVYVNDTLKFTVDVSGGDPKVTPTFNWTVSAGSIELGQRTSTIDVSTKEVAADSTVTATVELGGFDRECGYGSVAASCTTMVLKKVDARKLDEYGSLKPKEENAKLDNFMTELNLDPTAQCYIIAYNGRTSRVGDARKAADKERDYLVGKRSLEANRSVIVDGGYREQLTLELWLVPSGAQPPKPTPTVTRSLAKPTNPAKRTKLKTITPSFPLVSDSSVR